MDLATKLFTLSFGVEPNKATIKDFSDILNSAVLSLSDKQKALSDYAETAQPQTYTASQSPAQPQPKLRPAKPQVRWQITEEKLKELLWKRAQLLQFERARIAREKAGGAGGVGKGKAETRGKPPKLGKSKKELERNAKQKGEKAKGGAGTIPKLSPKSSLPAPKPAGKTPEAAPKSKTPEAPKAKAPEAPKAKAPEAPKTKAPDAAAPKAKATEAAVSKAKSAALKPKV